MKDHIRVINKYLHNGEDEALDNRIERLRKYIDKVLKEMTHPEERKCGYIHLYGVSQACALIAMRRNLNVELATMAGMLHDLNSYKAMNTDNHAELGEILARKLLGQLEITTEAETDMICRAIRNHSNKSEIHSSFDEILKDADVLHHCLYNPMFPVMKHEEDRYQRVMTEFGIKEIR